MKRCLIASLLGVSFTLSSCATGYVYFQNYGFAGNSLYAYETPISYALTDVPSGKAGQPVDPTFTAALLYGFGTITDSSLLTLLPPQTGYTDLNFGPPVLLEPYPTLINNEGYDVSYGDGIFFGPLVEIPGYLSGPITFQVIAYSGSSYESSSIRGSSLLFTLPSLFTQPPSTGTPYDQGELWVFDSNNNVTAGLASFTVQDVPEPLGLSLLIVSITVFFAWHLAIAEQDGYHKKVNRQS